MAVLVILLVTLLVTLIVRLANRSISYYRPSRFPPGPRQLPFLGNLLEFRKSPLKALMKWKAEYGNIVGFRLGQSRVIAISDFGLIKEAFNNIGFNARPNFKPALLFAGGQNHGTLTSAGEPWDTVRRFTIKNLNQQKSDRGRLESLMEDDIQRLIGTLRKESGKSVNFKDKFYLTLANQLWSVLMGQVIPEHERDHFQNSLVNLNRSLWKGIGSSIWFMDEIAELFPGLTGLAKLKETLPNVKSLVKNRIAAKVTKDVHDPEPSDLMSAFLAEIDKAASNDSSVFHKQSGANHMEGTILNLFVTGAETLANVLNWSLLYLSLYPEVQEKLYQEIVEIVGTSRLPSLNDQTNMPYTKALTQELLRISSTSPFANFHETTADVEFQGYLIPKNTVVIGNLFGVHHDASIWGDPETFRPERFLKQEDNNNNNKNNNAPSLIPFSVGLRTCIGQTFARKQLFMLLVSMCQEFKFEWDPRVRKPTAEELIDKSHVSIFRFTFPFKLILTERNGERGVGIGG